ncbi:hypothetical protein HN928_01210 [bacterium]|jgi:hypothetical protein|nr:hypothetical protein [bacterium]MBT7553254.1 hypothetical protein [bacterium]
MKVHVRKIINITSLIILILAFYFLFTGHSIFIFFGYIAFSAVLFLPRIIYRRLGLHENFSNELLDWIELFFSGMVLLSVAGYLWLFDLLYNYDAYVHFFTPLFIFVIVAVLFKAGTLHWNIKTTKSDNVLASLVITMSIILLWELLEYFITTYLGKNMFFTASQPNDTLYDVVVGFMSLPAGAVLMYKYNDILFSKLKK